MELKRRTDREDGRIVYIFWLAGDNREMPVYKSDLQSGIVTVDEIKERLIEMRLGL